MSILSSLLEVEKSLLGAVEDVAGSAGDAVAAVLRGAATAVREVIDTVGGEEGE